MSDSKTKDVLSQSNIAATTTSDAAKAFLAQLQQDAVSRTQVGVPKDASSATDRLSHSSAGQETLVYPNRLIVEAQLAGKELTGYLTSGKNLDDVIQYTDDQGQIRESTVAARIDSLKSKINSDSQQAIAAANELTKQNPNLEKDLSQATSKLQSTAQQFGLDYHSPNFVQQAETIPQLKDLLGQQEILQSERMAPAAAMLTYAMLKADGLTDKPAASMEAFRNTGKPQPTNQELNDAFLLVSQAGRTNAEVFNSPLFGSVSSAVKSAYAQTQEGRGNQIVTMLKQADLLSQSGYADKAGALYEQAWKLGETIDQSFVAAQLRLKANQDNPQVAQALIGILSNVKEARMHYADFLVKKGNYADALPIALSVGADTPEFAAQDPTYNKLVSDATFGKTLPQGDLKADQAKFADLMQQKNYVEAGKVLDALVKNYQDTSAQLTQVNHVLDNSKKDLDAKLQDLEKKKNTLDQNEYSIEKARLDGEKTAIDQNQQMNAQFAKQGPYLTYLQGVLAYSRDDKSSAHALFEQVKKTDPELAKNPQLQLDQLLDATKHKNWFQRNWHAIATTAAVVAGVAVGIGVGFCTFGVGGIAAGGATTSAILGTLGGAAAGGAVYSGTKGLALGFNHVGWSDFKDGAILGGTSALMVTGGPLLAGFSRLPEAGAVTAAATDTFAAGGIAAGDLATADATTQAGGWLARGARAALGTRRTAATGLLLAGSKEGYDMAFNGKSFGDAAKSFAYEAPLAVLGSGFAASRGLTFARLGLNWRSVAMGSAVTAGTQGIEMASDGESFKDASRNFFKQAPLYSLGFGWAGKSSAAAISRYAANAADPTYVNVANQELYGVSLRAGALGSVAPIVGPIGQIGSATIAQLNEHVLDPNNPSQSHQIWSNYNKVNPQFYRPQDVAAGAPESNPTDQQKMQQPLTQKQIDALSNAPITDNPLPK